MSKNIDFKQMLVNTVNREQNELPKHFDALQDVCSMLHLAVGEENGSECHKRMIALSERLQEAEDKVYEIISAIQHEIAFTK
jgi:hypothetical protein